MLATRSSRRLCCKAAEIMAFRMLANDGDTVDWRRERDSNPRYGCPYTRSPGVRLQPLGHPSMPVFRGAAEGSERPPDAQCGAARMDELSLINERPVGPPGRAAYDFRSGPARAMTCISPSAPAIATL